MLKEVGVENVKELLSKSIPDVVYDPEALKYNNDVYPDADSSTNLLTDVKSIIDENKLHKNYLGQGFYGTIMPQVLQRTVFSNPAWYTAYTPYQAEISQGRLECLMNFQVMITKLTGLEISNASLLDEASSAAEAMIFMAACSKIKKKTVFVANTCWSATIDSVRTHAEPLGIKVVVGPLEAERILKHKDDLFGVIIQGPDKFGV